MLQAVFKIMGYKEEEIEGRFGHMLEAFTFGAPPHGGFAPGIDRIVMILQNEPNIWEVIAFPKTGDAKDLMMGAPSEISKEVLNELYPLSYRNKPEIEELVKKAITIPLISIRSVMFT